MFSHYHHNIIYIWKGCQVNNALYDMYKMHCWQQDYVIPGQCSSKTEAEALRKDMRQLEHGQSLTHVSVMIFFNMESPSVCPWGPCQAEPYSRYSRWHAEWRFRMYSTPAQPLNRGPVHLVHNRCSFWLCHNVFELW